MSRLFLALTTSLLVLIAAQGSAYAAQPTGCLPSSLKNRLSEIRGKFGPITIVSTYRRGAHIAGTHHRSKHADCRAVDFEVHNKGAAFAWLDKVHGGGLGNYHGACNHLHIDDGPRARWNRNYCG
jgi:uncharacterized protein YcbK (DUF882 family)